MQVHRAIVESVIDMYHFRVRVPLYDRATSNNVHTKTSELDIATVCTLPNCHPNIKVGDVVIVAYEQNEIQKPIIIGYLYRNAEKMTSCDMDLNNLVVTGRCTLPNVTSIGNISSKEVNCLSGSRESLQKQIDNLMTIIDTLRDRLTNLEKVHPEMRD